VNFDIISYQFYRALKGIWLDISDYVIGDVNGFMGIPGYGPMDRIAARGTIHFTLKNTDNAFTPNHINCILGFEKGTKFKLVITHNGLSSTLFYGTIEDILPEKIGLHWYTHVTAYDYIYKLATHDLQLPAYTTNKSIDEAVPLVIANMPIAPISTDYNAGQDTFPYIFDSMQDKTIALQELAKLAHSELGYIYIKHGAAADEILVVDGRYTRTAEDIKEVPVLDDINLALEDGNLLALEDGTELILDTYTEDVEFTSDNTAIGMESGRYYYNEVKTKVYPRKIDAAATSVLFNLEHYITISAGETVTITGRFRDPDQEAVSVAGLDMVTPVATIDYLMNTASDGSGSDITADLTVTVTYGANGAEYELTNNNASVGYVTKLQARGKGVYIYRPVEYGAEYSTGINADGRQTLYLDMKYQNNPLAGESFAENILDIYSQKRLVISGLEYYPNRNNTLASAFMFCSVGDRIHVAENDTNQENDFIIHSIDFKIIPKGVVACRYGLMSESLLPASDFWRLGTVGKSELGVTTKLGF